MPTTDNPLKLYITAFAVEFAEWLLGQPVQHVQPLNVELPAAPQQIDLLFLVTLPNGQVVLLHIELQGRRTHRPMPYRMLEYMSRVVLREFGDELPLAERPRLHSAVLYLEQGAGAEDAGEYRVLNAYGGLALTWHYEVVRLWQMSVQELLQLNQPAFLALLGLIQVEEPAQVVPEALARIQQVPDEAERQQILSALAIFLSNEEALEMVEQVIDELDELILERPLGQRVQRRVRAEIEAEFQNRLVEERAEFQNRLVEERVEARAEGRAEGQVETYRDAILEVITARFNPLADRYRQIERALRKVEDPSVLQGLLSDALRVENVEAFADRLAIGDNRHDRI